MTDVLFQTGVSPAEAGLPPPEYRTEVVDGMRIERDVAITLSDGFRIYADVYRPNGAKNVPVILAWGPYGKHLTGPANYAHIPNEKGEGGCGVDPAWLSPYTGFEAPDPVAWVNAGYAVMTVNPRALWWSEGDYATIWGEREARDVVDAIAWAGTQEWSSGKVGMCGVSYLAIIQWWVAAMRPPYLAAINPCEGASDIYREFLLHGGIRDTGFPVFWQHNRLKFSTSKVEAIADMVVEHPLDDAYWDSKRPDPSQIEVPAYVIASWSDQGLHTRGTLAAFEKLKSAHKYLEIHGRKKWAYFHEPSTFDRQREFFDRFLKGKEGTDTEAWPLVRYELRTGYYEGVQCVSDSWPLPGRALHELHLDAATGSLVGDAPEAATASYTASEDGGEAVFDYRFDRETNIVGSAGLRLWITAEDADDADLFVGLRKFDADGNAVDFPFANTLEKGPVALGWLRASHRETDPARSTPDRPWHPHHAEKPLVPGEPTLVEIELWPSGTRFLPGERLQLVVRGSDIYTKAMFSRHQETRNQGRHTISTGGSYDSKLIFGILENPNPAPAG